MSIEMDSLLNQKKNIFEHIFYEFSMYYQSYCTLIRINTSDTLMLPNKQFWKNVLIESHAIHLRNLIEFFSCEKGTISANTILKEVPKLGIPETNKKVWAINKAVSHLTIERVDASTGKDNLSLKMSNLIGEMFPIVSNRIKDFLKLLANNGAIEEKYMADFSASEIQYQYRELSKWFNKE